MVCAEQDLHPRPLPCTGASKYTEYKGWTPYLLRLTGPVESEASGHDVRIHIPGWGWGPRVGKLGSPAISQGEGQTKGWAVQ